MLLTLDPKRRRAINSTTKHQLHDHERAANPTAA
jgi:hypothetical protein